MHSRIDGVIEGWRQQLSAVADEPATAQGDAHLSAQAVEQRRIAGRIGAPASPRSVHILHPSVLTDADAGHPLERFGAGARIAALLARDTAVGALRPLLEPRAGTGQHLLARRRPMPLPRDYTPTKPQRTISGNARRSRALSSGPVREKRVATPSSGSAIRSPATAFATPGELRRTDEHQRCARHRKAAADTDPTHRSHHFVHLLTHARPVPPP